MNIPMQNTVADYYTAHYTGPAGRRRSEPLLMSLGAFVSPAAVGLAGKDCVAKCVEETYLLHGEDLPQSPQSLQNACRTECGDQWYQSDVFLTVAAVGTLAGLAGGAYHGYKRNDSVGWAIGWGILGSWFWPIAIPVMFAQGFGEKKR